MMDLKWAPPISAVLSMIEASIPPVDRPEQQLQFTQNIHYYRISLGLPRNEWILHKTTSNTSFNLKILLNANFVDSSSEWGNFPHFTLASFLARSSAIFTPLPGLLTIHHQIQFRLIHLFFIFVRFGFALHFFSHLHSILIRFGPKEMCGCQRVIALFISFAG